MSGASSSFSPAVGHQLQPSVGTLNRFTTRLQADKTSIDNNNNSSNSTSSSGDNLRIKLVRGQPGLLSAVEREGAKSPMNELFSANITH